MSCKTLSIHPESQTKTIEPLVLGSIGSGKEFILQKGFNDASYPAYKKPIKVTILRTPFNKSTYKSFLKVKQSQSKDISIQYLDSPATASLQLVALRVRKSYIKSFYTNCKGFFAKIFLIRL
ncbi:hypothetical protein [Wocania ichthyoenteri]|uniref:hypothetical protein n=1 Tax=Wocania ichthyoenteri TaxID=1230531 RepID=UPI00053EFA6E|nr:hypothetical protein [Wocania ichthyoenteri]